MNTPNTLLCTVTGPSGAGKSTLVEDVLALSPLVCRVQNWTTRPSRGPMDTDYRFVSMQAFEEKYASGGFISTREVAGERYGATMPTAERVNMVIVDPPGVHMIRSNLSHLVASGTLSFVHFLLDTP